MKNIERQSPSPAITPFLIIVLTISIVGYFGFRLYTSLEVNAHNVGSLFLLAPIAGIASFFSPCSYPLLVTILGRTLGIDKSKSTRTKQAFQLALAFSIGVSAFLLLFGTFIALAGGFLFQNIEFASQNPGWLRIILGTILVGLSLLQIGKVPQIFHKLGETSHGLLRTQAKVRRKNTLLGFFIYGFAYVLAGSG